MRNGISDCQAATDLIPEARPGGAWALGNPRREAMRPTRGCGDTTLPGRTDHEGMGWGQGGNGTITALPPAGVWPCIPGCSRTIRVARVARGGAATSRHAKRPARPVHWLPVAQVLRALVGAAGPSLGARSRAGVSVSHSPWLPSASGSGGACAIVPLADHTDGVPESLPLEILASNAYRAGDVRCWRAGMCGNGVITAHPSWSSPSSCWRQCGARSSAGSIARARCHAA